VPLAISMILVAVGAWILLNRDAAPAAQPAGNLPSAPFSVSPDDAPVEVPRIGVPFHTVRADGTPCVFTLEREQIAIPSSCAVGTLVPTTRGNGGRGDLLIPDDVREVGVWDEGAGVGDPRGNTLLVGHVTNGSQGPGALAGLYRLRPNDVVFVAPAEGAVQAWRTAGLEAVERTRLPADVFAGKDGPRRLTLVTCGGPVTDIAGQGRSYRDNVIATAYPAVTAS